MSYVRSVAIPEENAAFALAKMGKSKTFSIVSTAGRAEICLPCMQTLWDFMEQTGARKLIRISGNGWNLTGR